MNEEEEFGMDKTALRETDPMEQEARSAVQDHPDFRFLRPEAVRAAVGSSDPLAVPTWLTIMPVDKDASKWTILEVQIRPDRAWDVMKELIGTVCMSKGLVLAEENANSVLFRRKVAQESLARGMANSATFQNVFVRIGVSPSKLRVVHICTLVSGENKLLGGLVNTTRQVPFVVQQEYMRTLQFALDQLLGALQATIIAQCLTLSHLYMSTPENSMDAVEQAELDPGYVRDVKRMFASEMKLNMRDLCIPLEEYAYQQEFACALLIGLLDPLLKKHGITLTEAASPSQSTADAAAEENAKEAESGDLTIPEETKPTEQAATDEPAASPEDKSDDPEKSTSEPAQTDKPKTEAGEQLYCEVITTMVQDLWREYKTDSDAKVKAKIEEKKKQVTARVEAVQELRTRAVESIMDAEGAEVTNLKASTAGERNDVLLYDVSCVVNTMPVKLHVTYGALIYRTLVPFFATTTVIPFDDITNVAHTTALGIQVLAVELNPETHPKGLTIAMGLEVDLLYQLLSEILSMHKQQRKSIVLPSLQQIETEKDQAAMKRILGAEEEEEKDEEPPSTAPVAPAEPSK